MHDDACGGGNLLRTEWRWRLHVDVVCDGVCMLAGGSFIFTHQRCNRKYARSSSDSCCACLCV